MRRTSNIRQIGYGQASVVVNGSCRIPEASPADAIPRRRLLRHLVRFEDRKILLFVSPPGSGKTELARQWAQQRRSSGKAVAWLTLASAVTNIDTLLLSLIKSLSFALSRADNMACEQPTAKHSRDELNEVINEIDTPGHGLTLVLDGYDSIVLPEIHEEVARFVNDLPPAVQVVITTRRPLPWSVGRYRVARNLCTFDFSEIRFDEDESTKFITENGPDSLDQEQIRELVESCDGWIAALILTLPALMPGQSRRRVTSIIKGRNIQLDEYISETIFDHLPNKAKEFLVSCATLDRLSASLCEYVTGSESASSLLEDLARNYLIIEPTDVEHNWYRVPAVQGRFLRSRFDRKPINLRRKAHRLASEWYVDNEHPREALRHALAIDDFEAVKKILRLHGRHMVDDGDIRILTICMDLLKGIDPGIEPLVCFVFVWTCVIVQRYKEARVRLDRLKQQVDSNQDIRDGLSKHVQGLDEHFDVIDYRIRQALDPNWSDSKMWEELRSSQHADAHFKLQHIELALATTYLRRGRYNDAYTMYMSVRSNAQATNSLITGVAASIRMAQIRLIQGRIPEALDLCDEIVVAADAPDSVGTPAPVSGVAYLIRAQIHYERNNLARCERDVARARSLVTQFGLAVGIVPLDILTAHIAYARRGPVAAANQLIGADRIPAHEGLRRSLERIWSSQAWFLLQAQDLETGGSLLKKLQAPVDRKGPSPVFSCSVIEEDKYRALCLYLIANNRTISASAWLTKLNHQAETTGRTISRINFGALLALCHSRAGHKGRALRALRQSLVLAERCGCFRSVLDTGPEIVGLIREFSNVRRANKGQIDRGPSDVYLSKLLAICDSNEGNVNDNHVVMIQQVAPAARLDVLHSPLTPRELEILTCICDGLSNRSISEDLMIGEGTVKWHTKNIYSKLGVNSRTQAAAKARSLRLVN